jgi:V/A-type H+-transporting ATPase subunit D
MTDRDRAPTRAAVLALQEERKVVSEAYEFLDEKRLLLAAESLSQLQRYEQLQAELTALAATAREQLRAAVKRHGLQGLSVYPERQLDGFHLETRERNFMGVTLVENGLDMSGSEADSMVAASNPSREAEACRQTFDRILRHSVALAGVSGNLYRLLLEYRLTERRARALENVILPELDQALSTMSTQLEEMDLEDVVRAHRYGTQSQPC